MKMFNTEMHVVTFIISCIEFVILFYQVMHKLARPKDTNATNNIILLALLLIYNIASGLLPDKKLPGGVMLQNIIAYGAGFIAPCFFPYYMYKSFKLPGIKYHAYKGVFLFFIIPFLLFCVIYLITNSLNIAKDILGIVLIYAVFLGYTLVKSIRAKYKGIYNGNLSQEEALMLLSILPWATLPIVVFFDLSQAAEAIITNSGFLLSLGLLIKDNITKARAEHERVLNWNTVLQNEVDKRTNELKRLNDEKTTAFINVAHEIKTPLTLINNYLDDYIEKQEESEQLIRIKKSIEKLNKYVANFFDIEKVANGFTIYNNSQVCDFSNLLKEKGLLFQHYAIKNKIHLNVSVEDGIFIKAAPEAIDRIINNLIENALKFTDQDGEVTVELQNRKDKVLLSVRDNGIGIDPKLEKNIFQPYYQINNPAIKKNHGLGLGLPIVKKIVEELHGEISFKSNPDGIRGTTFLVFFPKFTGFIVDTPVNKYKPELYIPDLHKAHLRDSSFDPNKTTVLLVEDNLELHSYIFRKLEQKFNVYSAANGKEAISKLKQAYHLPDLIVSDVMMDNLDGLGLMQYVGNNYRYKHIPVIFLSAKTTKNDKLKGLALGAVDFVEKPFSIDLLIKKIESILLNAKHQKSAFAEVAYNTLKEGQSKTEIIENEQIELVTTVEIPVANFGLSAREMEVAELLGKGATYKAISDSLFISPNTVTKHVQNIYGKLEVKNKVEMINKLGLK